MEGVRIHYPTLMQSGSRLLLVYSKFYLGNYNTDVCKSRPKIECIGLYSNEQGIKFAALDISALWDLPQMYVVGRKQKEKDREKGEGGEGRQVKSK